MDITLDASGEDIVVYFGTVSDGSGIEAPVFGNALVAFDALYRAINLTINPGVAVEIDFVRSDQGSVKAVLRAIKKDVQGLVAAPVSFIVLPFLINIFTTWLTESQIKIIVNDNSYIVEHGTERVVLPRAAAEQAKKVGASPQVRQSVRNFFAVVEADPKVRSVDFRTAILPDVPIIPIVREQFGRMRELPEVASPSLPKQRKQPYNLERLVVLKAVLERSKSRWQFLWNGQRVSADVADVAFFAKLANHEYEFGQGDALIADLLVEQELNEVVGAYENKRFHVTRVHSHTKGPRQWDLDLHYSRDEKR